MAAYKHTTKSVASPILSLSELKTALAELTYDSDSFYHQVDRRRHLQDKIVEQARREAVPTVVKQNRIKNILSYWKKIIKQRYTHRKSDLYLLNLKTRRIFANGFSMWENNQHWDVPTDALDRLIAVTKNTFRELKRATKEASCSHPVAAYSLDSDCEPGDGVYYQHRCDACGGYLNPKTDLDRY